MRVALVAVLAPACYATHPVEPTETPTPTFVKGAMFGPTAVEHEVTFPFEVENPDHDVVISLTAAIGIKFEQVRIGGFIAYQWGVAYDYDCGNWSWHLTAKAAGPDLTVAMESPGPITVSVLELSSIGRQGTTVVGEHREGQTISMPRAPAEPGDVVVSSIATCGTLSLDAASEFSLIGISEGVGVAYYIPTESGTYGADWRSQSASWEAITLAYREQPQGQ